VITGDLWRRLVRLLRRDRFREELEEEMRLHQALRAEAQRQTGMTPEAAANASRRAFGNLGVALEASQDAWGGRWLDALGQDLRFAVRTLLKSPRAVSTIALLGLGLGVTTALFSVFSAVVLRPVPFPAAEQLVVVWSTFGTANRASPSYPDFVDWRAASQPGSLQMAFVRGKSATIRRSTGAETMLLALVSEGYFRVLGARPAMGRLFTPADERADAPRVVVLTHETWQQKFGGATEVLGSTASFADGPAVIVGVLPRGWGYPTMVEAFTPIASTGSVREDLTRRDLRGDNIVIGRLAAGASLEQSTLNLGMIATRLATTYPENAGFGIRLESLVELEASGARANVLLLLLAAVSLLVLLTSNVANLSLIGVLGRSQEFAIREALGAGRSRVARQLVIENLTLALAASAVGVLVAVVMGRILVRIAPVGLPGLDSVTLNWPLFAVAGGLAIVCGLSSALLPVITAGRINVIAAVQEGGRGASEGRGRGVAVTILVATETGVAVALLIVMALLLQSFQRLRAIDPGFEPERLVALRVAPPQDRYATGGAQSRIYSQIEEAVRAVPGVTEATIVNHLAMTGTGTTTPVRLDGRSADDSMALAGLRTVSPSYFTTMGVPLRRGRLFGAADMDSTARVAIIDELFVARYFAGRDPIGERIVVERRAPGPDYSKALALTVVGVVENVRQYFLTQELEPTVYVPAATEPWWAMYVVARVSGPPGAFVERLRAAVREVDPDVPVSQRVVVQDLPRLKLPQERFTTTVLVVFASTAMVVALMGMYGMVAYTAAQRRRDIAIRVALGAPPRAILRQLVVTSLWPTAIGVVIGIGGAVLIGRVLRSLLFGVTMYDPLTLVSVVTVVVVGAVAAAVIPALRASKLPPHTALAVA
jgi:putative ABC transport system permease protein